MHTKEMLNRFFPDNQATPELIAELNRVSMEYKKNFAEMLTAYAIGDKVLHSALILKERELYLQELKLRRIMRITIQVSDNKRAIKGGYNIGRKYTTKSTTGMKFSPRTPIKGDKDVSNQN